MAKKILTNREVQSLMVKTTKKKKPTTLKELTFLKRYYETGDVASSAMSAYEMKTREVAQQMGYAVLKKFGVKEILAQTADRAVLRIEQLAENAKSEYVKLEANKDLLDRAGYKAIERIESKNLNITISAETANRYKRTA